MSPATRAAPGAYDRPGARGTPHAPRPRDAATLVIVRRDGAEPRVLMGQRHRGHVFMPDKFVFPGGRVDICDMRLKLPGALRPEVEAKLGAGLRRFSPQALALAAVRETFEEAGLLVGGPRPPGVRTRAASWQKFLSHGVAPRLEALEFIARAITPPYRARRFDARFFMVDASEIQGDLHAFGGSDELLDLKWFTLAEARALDLPNITRRVLDEIELRAGNPEGEHPAPFFRFVSGRPVMELL